jgi:hypothetical protein
MVIYKARLLDVSHSNGREVDTYRILAATCEVPVCFDACSWNDMLGFTAMLHNAERSAFSTEVESIPHQAIEIGWP